MHQIPNKSIELIIVIVKVNSKFKQNNYIYKDNIYFDKKKMLYFKIVVCYLMFMLVIVTFQNII